MRRLGQIAAAAILAVLLPTSVKAEAYLVPVGKIIGLQLRDDTVTVASFDENLGSRAKACGLKIGDAIVQVNGAPIHSTEDVRLALEQTNTAASLTVLRGSRRMELELEPAWTEDGPKLGIFLRQGIAGVGTVTWFDPAANTFGALGHGVSDSRGCLLKLTQGTAFPAQVLNVVPGRTGHPGQLKGSADRDTPLGNIIRNTPQGIFGKAALPWDGTPIPTAEAEQIHTGPAWIRSTIQGDTPVDYAVEIVKLYPMGRKDGRNLLIKVTDPRLLSQTGGIVQGMSGSPILQDGRLVGAVTHVLVNAPTTGYGIFIGNMLDAAA